MGLPKSRQKVSEIESFGFFATLPWSWVGTIIGTGTIIESRYSRTRHVYCAGTFIRHLIVHCVYTISLAKAFKRSFAHYTLSCLW